MYFGNVKVNSIDYCFYDDRFFKVEIDIEYGTDIKPLKQAMIEKYGEPKLEKGSLFWFTRNVCIKLSDPTIHYQLQKYGDIDRILVMTYLPIYNEALKNMIEKIKKNF